MSSVTIDNASNAATPPFIEGIFGSGGGPANGYVTEDSLYFYVAEDGVTFYVQEV